MPSEKQKLHDFMMTAGRWKRQEKMESSARHKAWKLIKEKVAAAQQREAEALAAYEADPTPEARRRLLAARMMLACLKDRMAKTWT